MRRRRFLRHAALGLASAALAPRLLGQTPSTKQPMSYTLAPLPYPHAALEPHIDEATMKVHHTGHHQAYTDKLNAALLTLTYLGSERVVPNYNTMGLAKASLEASVRYLAASLGPKGVRVNGISAGPIKTLAASGIKGFGKILDVVEHEAPLRRNVTIDDVGNVAAFLLSDLAAGVTGEVTFVDAGFSRVAGGMAAA